MALATFKQADRFDTPQVSRWTWLLGAGMTLMLMDRAEEALRKVERVPVNRGDYGFPRRVVVLELYEDLPVLVGPDIGVNVLTIQ